VWYNILVKFGVHRKIIGLMKMSMHEVSSMYLSDAIPVNSGLK
jgi:hypothetical protein